MRAKMTEKEKTIIIDKKIYIVSLSIVSFFFGILDSICINSFSLFVINHINNISIINILKMPLFYIMAIAWAIIHFMFNCGLLLIAKINK